MLGRLPHFVWRNLIIRVRQHRLAGGPAALFNNSGFLLLAKPPATNGSGFSSGCGSTDWPAALQPYSITQDFFSWQSLQRPTGAGFHPGAAAPIGRRPCRPVRRVAARGCYSASEVLCPVRRKATRPLGRTNLRCATEPFPSSMKPHDTESGPGGTTRIRQTRSFRRPHPQLRGSV